MSSLHSEQKDGEKKSRLGEKREGERTEDVGMRNDEDGGIIGGRVEEEERESSHRMKEKRRMNDR